MAAETNTLILLSLSRHSGHGRTCRWFDPVANDQGGIYIRLPISLNAGAKFPGCRFGRQ
jgi:hypothetical protein